MSRLALKHARRRLPKPNTLLIIVPTYNERDTLPMLIPALLERAACRVMVVDDRSPDGTGAIADELASQHPGRLDVVHRTGPRGLGRSYVDGFRRALAGDAQLLCQMDADLSHDPTQLPHLISAAAHSDLVIGSRYVNGIRVVNWPLRRRVLSVLANRYVRRITGLRVSDCTSGFRCWRRDTLAALPLSRLASDGYAFLVETLFEAAANGARIAEVPIIFTERRLGRSKLSLSVLIESLVIPWRLVGRHGRRLHKHVVVAGDQ